MAYIQKHLCFTSPFSELSSMCLAQYMGMSVGIITMAISTCAVLDKECLTGDVGSYGELQYYNEICIIDCECKEHGGS